MSNRRRLRPPPTGWSYAKFIKIVQESDLPEETKQQVLIRAAYADRKGRLRDATHSPLR